MLEAAASSPKTLVTCGRSRTLERLIWQLKKIKSEYRKKNRWGDLEVQSMMQPKTASFCWVKSTKANLLAVLDLRV
jgi:hypothetical protein